MTAGRPAPQRESDLCARWAAGLAGPLRLEDGRALKVIFPGVPGGGSGPDFVGAILDAGGDLLRGDVEVHLLASGWRTHRHHLDPAYAGVVLHVAGRNDTAALTTLHRTGRAIPVLVLPPERGQVAFPPPFTPPCALAAARGASPVPALERLGSRRLRMKAAAAATLVASAGPGQALYALTLEILGGHANRAAFASLARRLPLAALLDRCASESPPFPRAALFAAELRGAAAAIALRRAGLRPMASPSRRLEQAAALFAHWWPAAATPTWPAPLVSPSVPLRGSGLSRALAIETWVNAVLPVAIAAKAWPDGDCLAILTALRSPGTYGKLRRLEGWLGAGELPFRSAARLQGGLLLHADYCTKGMCGRCPLSAEPQYSTITKEAPFGAPLLKL